MGSGKAAAGRVRRTQKPLRAVSRPIDNYRWSQMIGESRLAGKSQRLPEVSYCDVTTRSHLASDLAGTRNALGHEVALKRRCTESQRQGCAVATEKHHLTEYQELGQ
jgi:hypothetical protein